MSKIIIPLSVPSDKKSEYRKNYELVSDQTRNLFLIAGDQKIEHLNDDFYGTGITPEDATPEHLFKIAANSPKNLLALPLGLISYYGESYPNINYLVKLNSKTNVGDNEEKNSSQCLWTVEDVVRFKKQNQLKIVAVGYTIYLGNRYEGQMLAEAAKIINEAHQNGLLAVLWLYPRGKNIKEDDIHTIAGGAGVAAALGADFVKVKYPYGAKNKKTAAEKFTEVTSAAGNTRVICVGGTKRNEKELLEQLKQQIKTSGTAGIAIGRNLHQLPLADALRLAQKINEIIFPVPKTENKSSFFGF